jgi:predicted kinase
MNKLELTKPTLILLYGFPGAGKTFLARQLCEDLHAAHVQADRIRYELFEEPRYDDQENEIVDHLMRYMTEEFLAAGLSVVYDMNSARLSQRRS